MQVWNVLHEARWKYRTQKWRKKSPSAHHRTTLSGYIFAIKACTDNRKQQYPLHMSLQYGELRPTSGWDRFGCLGYPSEFQLVSRLGFVTAVTSFTAGQPNFAALNRGRHLYSAGRPSRWTLAHILVDIIFEICACNIRFNGVTQAITANVRVLNDGIEMCILLLLFYILLLLTQTRKPAAIAGLNCVSLYGSDRAKPGYSI